MDFSMPPRREPGLGAGRCNLVSGEWCAVRVAAKGHLPMRYWTRMLPLSLLLVCGDAHGAPDGFSGVRCGADIPQALRGQSMPVETVVKIENRHKNLGLRDLGADELEKGMVLDLLADLWQ
jgi:hypothetical protein